MGILDDINNAFDPKKNGVSDAFDPTSVGQSGSSFPETRPP